MLLLNVSGSITKRLGSQQGTSQPFSQSLGNDSGVQLKTSSSFGILFSRFSTWTHTESLFNQVHFLSGPLRYYLGGNLYGMFLGRSSGFVTQRLGSEQSRSQFPSQNLGSDSGVKRKASSSFGIPSSAFSIWIHKGGLYSQVRTPRGTMVHTKTRNGGGWSARLLVKRKKFGLVLPLGVPTGLSPSSAGSSFVMPLERRRRRNLLPRLREWT
jgi:hypothetical protein